MKCCICGAIKNCAPYLDKIFKNMEKIGSLFEDYIIILYYDHSNDGTLQKIKQYQQINEKLKFYVNIVEISPYRTHRIANARNGCLQMIRGSHKMGRIEHGFSGEQVGADMEKVNEALKIMPLEYLEMDFGDTAFFHCNTLHASAANLSDKPRWSIITAYNLVSNKPYKDVHASSYMPIESFKGDLLTQDAINITDDAEFLIK